MEVYIKPFEYNADHINGIKTYYNDFRDIVISEIKKHFDVVKKPTTNNLWFIRMPLPNASISSKIKYVVVLHHETDKYFPYYEDISKSHFFVSHYFNLFKKRMDLNIKYIPMSIDTKKLPQRKKYRNGKIIYFSNIFNEKQKIIDNVKNELGIDFDVLSKDILNGKEKVEHKDVLELVSEYEYGIGVGRSALEMLGMGLKVWVFGKQYGGVICDEVDLINHWRTNINSTYCNSESIKKDYEKLKTASIFKKDIFDMRNFAELYIHYLKWSFY